NAELASAEQSKKLESRVSEIAAKLAKTAGGTVMAEADPQASVLAKITGLEVDKVQTALTIFVALLIEIGSAFGMYVAFAYWRIGDQIPTKRSEETEAGIWQSEAEDLAPMQTQQAATAQLAQPRVWANDNKTNDSKP